MRAVFGEDWKSELMRKYTLAGSKTEQQVVNDVWHVLFNFDRDDKVIAWAKDRLGLDDKEAEEFAKTPVAEGYAALSLKALDRILPWLRKGYRYDESVMMANAAEAMGKNTVQELFSFILNSMRWSKGGILSLIPLAKYPSFD